MKLIKASTEDVFFKVDDEDFERLNGMKWYVRHCKHSAGHAVHVKFVRRNGKKTSTPIYMHRLVVNAPRGMDVDHINHDTFDNRKENLRICSHFDNLLNRRGAQRGSRSKYLGVGWSNDRQAWIATLRSKYLGIGRGPEGEIAMARLRDEHALREWGEKAVLNFPNGRNAVVEV